ncbi:MAG: ATP-binding protein [Candidatus Nitrosotenuis sp.]|jgi:two-component system sensor histidine kinase HydH
MSVKESFIGFHHKEILNSKIDDMFDFENTLPPSLQISDNVIDCIDLLKNDERCHDGVLVKSRDKYAGIITGRELSAALLSLGVQKFKEQLIGNYFSPNYVTLTKESTLLDFIQKIQRSRRGFGFITENKKLIGKLSIHDIASLYIKMNSNAALNDFPTHEMISVSPDTTIKQVLLTMMRHQIRKIFIEDKLCPFVSERNILGLVAKCAQNNDYTTLDKPITICEKNFALSLKEEKIKDACKKLLLSNSTCIVYGKKYVFTSWDIATSFLIDKIHDYQKQLLSSEKLAMMGELSAKLNHELRNPLSIVKNSAELLRLKLAHNLDKEHLSYFYMMEKAIERMTHQINDVLDFVKITDLNIEESSVFDLIENSLENITVPTSVIIEKNIQDHYLFCDAAKIRVVIRNLISNAMDALFEKQSGEKRILIAAKQDDHITVIEVRDSGIGISQKELERIFEPLFTTKQKGSGLGLAICKFIIEFHKGEISVFSKPNEGTVVTIRLPTKPFTQTN